MHWHELLKSEQEQEYFQSILTTIANERAQGVNIFPSDDELYTALELTSFDDLKVVILGQDPYHGPGQAHGLSFSVKQGVKIPPSLANMYKELATDIEGFTIPTHGNLTSWAKQGVLLLNTVLSVQQGNAHSHAKLGWERYTDAIIAKINEHKSNVVFVLWGAHAQKKGRFIDSTKHLVLTSAHPSPLSSYRGFFGCQHFSKINQYLIANKIKPIDWQIDEQQPSLF
ncbi:uracil-DNA glycosylase [Thalassomonas sp. M1454]|uniref:uracil-DNA glycosylase n=1 Tax=Thalassomonas sp. M1454 TaxID=2594477 RepID=UPI001C8F735D|nr:uracil-DNA glycosylase [Thalassomonas sp. M1454]